MAATGPTKSSWLYLPPEIRSEILQVTLHNQSSLASLAAVSPEWQAVIEYHNFARIKVTPARLAEFDANTRRNRALIRQVWLCFEVDKYKDLTKSPGCCMSLNKTDSEVVTKTIEALFTILQKWEPSDGLLFDLSVHSRSNEDEWLKDVTFEREVSDVEFDHKACKRFTMIEDDFYEGLERVDQEVLERYFDNVEEQRQWWKQLPSVPAVTAMRLRRQVYSLWLPYAWGCILARFPNMEEFLLEDWDRKV